MYYHREDIYETIERCVPSDDAISKIHDIKQLRDIGYEQAHDAEMDLRCAIRRARAAEMDRMADNLTMVLAQHRAAVAALKRIESVNLNQWLDDSKKTNAQLFQLAMTHGE